MRRKSVIHKFRINIQLLILVSLFLVPVFCTGQVIVTVAGNGIPANTGDGGPASSAQIAHPKGIITDAIGRIYFVSSSVIRRIDTSGIITTIAGNGITGYGSDGVPATATSLFFPGYITLVGSNIVFTEEFGYRIRMIDVSGIIHTIAGTGVSGFSGDGGPATAAMLDYPIGIASDVAGNIFFSDSYNRRIRKINTSGIISTVAGITWPTGLVYTSSMTGAMIGDGGPATNALIYYPYGICTDHHGNIFITDNYGRVRKINSVTGIINTVAGSPACGYGGDGGLATAANLLAPMGVSVDTFGNIFIADRSNNRIRKVDTFGIITTIAGNGYMAGGGAGGGFSGDYCYAPEAELFNPEAVHADNFGNVYISDGNGFRVRKVYAGNNPAFMSGSSKNFAVCHDSSPNSLDTVLGITDADANQTEIWSVFLPPSHGLLYASDTATYSGTLLTPSGTYYTPAPGYLGLDTFSVIVADCGYQNDTITVYVKIEDTPTVAVITGPNEVCVGDTITLYNSVLGGIWSCVPPYATISPLGVLTGITTGSTGVAYSIANSCATLMAVKPVNVIDCPNSVIEHKKNSVFVTVFPNPNNGTFDVRVVSSISENCEFSIFDVAGRLLYQAYIDTNKQYEVVNDFSEGVYFISAVTKSGIRKNERVIVAY